MLVTTSKDELSAYIRIQKKLGKSVGFVPTMGALHDGHMSLVRQAKAENDIVVCSIFVNPTQFNNPEDLEQYPRKTEKDLELLELHQCDVAFTPSNHEMYSLGETAQQYHYDGLENKMEGKFRPGHFDGVGTIVNKLLRIVQPDKAYFGEKDYQQLLIIKKLVEIEQLDVEIVGCAIQRESSGLAMSSRNERLSKTERENAAFIYQQLQWARENYLDLSLEEIHETVNRNFTSLPEFDLEYFAMVDGNTLEEIKDKSSAKAPRAFVSVHLSKVRLIDNIALN